MSDSIELVQQNDATSILEIYRPYIEQTPITFEYEVPSIEEFTNRIQKIASYYPYLVYKRENKLIGYAYANRYRERTAFLWDVETSIYISPAYQHNGIGKKLYNSIHSIDQLSCQQRLKTYIND